MFVFSKMGGIAVSSYVSENDLVAKETGDADEKGDNCCIHGLD